MAYRLTSAADVDLYAIYEDGFIRFGEKAADRYTARILRTLDLIGMQPRMARDRTEYDRPLRVHSVGSHMILYRLDGEDAVILRVRHAREDWQSDDAD